jgi:hypothetical protein
MVFCRFDAEEMHMKRFSGFVLLGMVALAVFCGASVTLGVWAVGEYRVQVKVAMCAKGVAEISKAIQLYTAENASAFPVLTDTQPATASAPAK